MEDLRKLYEHLIEINSPTTVKEIIIYEIEYNYPFAKKENLKYIDVIRASNGKLGINISFNVIIDGNICTFTYINNEPSLDINIEEKRVTPSGEIQNFSLFY